MKFEGNQHIVSQLQVKANYDEVDTVKETQEVVSRIIKYKFTEILERYCEQVDKERWMKISSMDLNLGAIPREKIEKELPRIFENKLETIFSSIRNNNYNVDGLGDVEVVDMEMRIIEGVVYFLKFGTIPWFLQEIIGSKSLNEVFAEIIESSHPDLDEQLTEVIKSSNAKRRLVNLLGENELKVLGRWGKSGIVAQRAIAILAIFKDVVNRISTTEQIQKSYLETYIKEYFLEVIIKDGKSRSEQSVDDLVHTCMQFLSQEKQIDPAKWVPQVIESIKENPVNRALADKVVPGVRKFYIEYLTQNKVNFTTSFDWAEVEKSLEISMSGKAQLKDKQLLRKTVFRVIQHLSGKIESVYHDIEYAQIEAIVTSIAREALTTPGVEIGDHKKVETIIANEVAVYFGKEKTVSINPDTQIASSEHSASREDEYAKSSEKKFSNLDTTLLQKGGAQLESPELHEDIDSKNYNIAGLYWKLFLMGGLQPFTKLYAAPAAELTKIFRELFKSDAEYAAQIVSENIQPGNAFIVGWWVQHYLDDEIVQFYKQVVKTTLEFDLPKEINYARAIMAHFFSTGFYPWPEIAKNGKDKLQETVLIYFSDENIEELKNWLNATRFFTREAIISRVFNLLPVQYCKQLLQIRDEFLNKGLVTHGEISFNQNHEASQGSRQKNMVEHSDSKGAGKDDKPKQEQGDNLSGDEVSVEPYDVDSGNISNQETAGSIENKKGAIPGDQLKEQSPVSEESAIDHQKKIHSTQSKQQAKEADLQPDDDAASVDTGDEDSAKHDKDTQSEQSKLEQKESEEKAQENNQFERKQQTIERGQDDSHEIGITELQDTSEKDLETTTRKLGDLTGNEEDQKTVSEDTGKKRNEKPTTEEELFLDGDAKPASREKEEQDVGSESTDLKPDSHDVAQKREAQKQQSLSEKEREQAVNEKAAIKREDADNEAYQQNNWLKDVPRSNLIDHIAALIMDFYDGNMPINIKTEILVDKIYRLITESAKNKYYETAAMLASISHDIINPLLDKLHKKQLEFIRKMVQAYQTKFVSLAEEIKEAEEAAKRKYQSLDLGSGEPVFIQNAGLVLLNPYLKRLFVKFDLLEGKEFKSDQAKEKAVYLLQYLAKKQEEPEEFELTLNKILCGIPLGIPIKNAVELTDSEKDVCDGLLIALIKNWKALKNTSPDGLRTSFLMREGSLKRDASGWKLNVEKKVYDILLEKLPWGYSMIHFPWMEYPLYTEWEGN